MLLRTGRQYFAFVSLLACLLVLPVFQAAALAAESDESSIVASNAVVVDAETGRVLYEKGMSEAVPPASLTKIFTTIVALETAALQTEMTVDAYDLVGEASLGLVSGERLTLETLLFGLMLTSGNDAAMTVSRELAFLPGDTPQESVSRFVERINAMADRLGLSDTQFRNPHGLDQSGHVSSARDIAAMTRYALDNPVFERLISTPYYGANGREFYNVNQFLDVYPGLIGGKTGVTSKAGYCLLQVAERDGKTVIAVLLGSDRENWYADSEYLLNLGFEELEKNPNDDTRPVIGSAGLGSLEVPEISGSYSVGGNLTVDRLSDYEAVVRPSSPVSGDESGSWRWLLVSFGTMGAALVLMLHYPSIIGMGALVINRGSQIRLTAPAIPALSFSAAAFSRNRRSRARKRQRLDQGGDADRWSPHTQPQSEMRRSGRRRVDASMSEPVRPADVTDSPARLRAEGGIKLAMQGRYHVATEEFRLAIERDPLVEITHCPGFWRMQPMGYIAVAKAYALNGQRAEARRLLTVVQLGFNSNKQLVRLFGRAIEQLGD